MKLIALLTVVFLLVTPVVSAAHSHGDVRSDSNPDISVSVLDHSHSDSRGAFACDHCCHSAQHFTGIPLGTTDDQPYFLTVSEGRTPISFISFFLDLPFPPPKPRFA